MDSTTDDAALLHAIMEAAVDAIIVADESGTIASANPAACQLFNYDSDELIGQSVNNLMPEAVAELHDGFIARYIETGEKRIIGIGRDVEGQAKDGSIIPLHLSVGTARIDGKSVFVGILHDLTLRKTTQAALARSQRLDAIGQMTGGVAHDFNNLLTVVIGSLELLEMRGADDGQKALIKEALDAAELGADLTSRLMVFARKSNLKPIRADLRDICTDTLAILERTLGESYRIETDFAQDLSHVMIDPVQLQSTLMNLTLNARDAMGGKGEFLISVANVTIDDTYMAQEIDMEPGEYVRISVSDNGAGMDDEAQKRAFEPFFTTKTDSGGSGLGLAMVYGFVRQSGGHITLYSEPGLGTSFGLYFPALPNLSGIQEATAEPSAKTEHSLLGQGETVLIVEDNQKVRGISIERIRDLGYNVEAAESGDQAYAILKSGTHVDVLFSDLVMPGTLNGYDLAAKVAAEFPHLKVLLTSGYSSDVVTSSMAHEQTYDILHKPYRQSELALRLQALLADRAEGRTTSTSQENV